MPWRGISNLLALLIAVGIVIGVAIIVNGIVSDILVKQKPEGGDVVLTGFVWWWEYLPGEDSYVIHVKGNIVNLGTERINVTGAYAVINNIEYALRFRKIENLKPNSVSELVGSVKASVLDTNALTVVVEWCSAKGCSKSVSNAQLSAWVDVINRNIYGVIMVTVPADSDGSTTTTITLTQTETVTTTTTVPITTTTITSTQTVTTTYTTTMTQAVTTTTTVIQTKPSWPVTWTACYDISDNIYVSGALLEPVSNKESIPYVVKYLECGLLGCRVLAVKPFEWVSKSSFESKYYLLDP